MVDREQDGAEGGVGGVGVADAGIKPGDEGACCFALLAHAQI